MQDKAVLQIPKRLEGVGEIELYTGSFEIDSFEYAGAIYKVIKPISYNASLANTGEAILLSGDVECALSATCGRCLEECEINVQGKLEGFFIFDPSVDGASELEGDEFDILPEDKKIDLAPYINSAILLELPYTILCDEGCKGICLVCGENLNQGNCTCEKDLSETHQSHSPGPFAVLESLKNKA